MNESEPQARPSGAVAFLFTGVEGSTKLWERDADQMRAALQAHDEILRDNFSGKKALDHDTG